MQVLPMHCIYFITPPFGANIGQRYRSRSGWQRQWVVVWTFCFPFALCMAFGLGWSPNGVAQSVPDSQQLFYETDIRPILKTHCFHCHGESDHRESGLDLRLVRFMQSGGDSGPALHPGSPADSLLWQRVEADEMPPGNKYLSQPEKDLLRRWIESGAATKRTEPEQPSLETWTEEERSYWVFRPVQRPMVPRFSGSEAEREPIANPIDAFILYGLQQRGLTFSPPADRVSLIRRLSLDLLGMPPSPEEVTAFAEDPSPDAYEQLVDRWLSDPRYGERWGRHWLDVAGYADSDGYTEQDAERPWAYPYRDYVIQAHNRDTPADQFVIEQMAGDELVPLPWDRLQPDQIERLAATGFLRTAPDGTGQEGVDANVARNDVVAETIKIVSSSFLGLTVGCAQCHDHRYDPISQKDYYRIRAILEPGLDWKQWRDRNAKLVNLWVPEEKQRAADVDKELAELEGKRVAELDSIVNDIFDKEVMKLMEELREPARMARSTPADQRTAEQQKLMRDYPSLNVDRGSAILYDGARINEFNKKYDTEKTGISNKRPADRYLASFSEVPEQTPTTFVFARGDFQQPKDPVSPGSLSILDEHEAIPLDDPNLTTSGRRLAFAKLLTKGTHPLLTRTLVNQIWAHHFGRGIAAMPGDLGMLGERPTHPELLDWLASEWVESGWSRKRLHRLILTSKTYQQSSSRSGRSHEVDPENLWLGRMSIRRLDAETVRDSMLMASGSLVNQLNGPPIPVNPDEVGQIILGKATRDGNGILVAKQEDTRDSYRRSIYTQIRRSMPLGVLEPFDPATLSPNCDRRPSSTVATQSLLMMNNGIVIQLSENFARRVQREVGDDSALQIAHAWRLAFGTPATPDQLTNGVDWIDRLRQQLTKPTEGTALPSDGEPPGTLEAVQANHQALALYCQSLFSSNAFLYVD
jgi:hypothetical protein